METQQQIQEQSAKRRLTGLEYVKCSIEIAENGIPYGASAAVIVSRRRSDAEDCAYVDSKGIRFEPDVATVLAGAIVQIESSIADLPQMLASLVSQVIEQCSHRPDEPGYMALHAAAEGVLAKELA